MAPLDTQDPAPPVGLEALLAFWADAGVDVCLSETPVDRLAEGVRKLAPPLRESAPSRSAGVAAPPSPSSTIRVDNSEGPDIAAAIAAARTAAAAAQNLTALEAAIAAFDGCPLKRQGARNPVFARGDPTAPVMIIGEGPGADEDLQGKPFVGRAGKLLDKMLAAAGLGDRVFITNTVFWRPPGNRNPTPAEQATCAPFLERAIRLVEPRLLLLSGGVSAKWLLKREEGILSLRGKWFDWRSEDGTSVIPALPTLHPAFLLRQPAAKAHAWKDLLTLLSRLDRDL
jgi:DNA polymerase